MSHARLIGPSNLRLLPQSWHHNKKVPRFRSLRTMAKGNTIHLLRHGKTEMNVFLEEHGEDCKDPLFFDTKLTDQGKQEARAAIAEASSLKPPPQLLLSSPLSRALQTAEIAFEKFRGERMALSLARERTYFASDVGVRRSDLERLWPDWSFEGVSEEVWWLDHTEDKSDPKKIIPESEGMPFMAEVRDHFQQRMERLKNYLSERTEQSIVLVVHRDVIESLIGRSPANCEFATIKL